MKDPNEISVDSTTTTRSKSIFIFDWDDTFMPSSWMDANHYLHSKPVELPDMVLDVLSRVSSLVEKLLYSAMANGKVLIITNSEQGWVQLSAALFMPQLLPLLKDIKIISARTIFEERFPGSPVAWKSAAFGSVLDTLIGFKNIDDSSTTTLISIGDGHDERIASRIIAAQHNIYVKSIQFMRYPDPVDICHQLESIIQSFPRLCTYAGNLDLSCTLPRVKRCANDMRNN